MADIKSNNYWAFLEEIEAPMWVDLTLEGKSYNQNIDDTWFYTHHPVYQSSSQDLKSAFSQLFEEGKILEFELSVSSSPSLPNSISRSRGKDFDDKKCRGSCRGIAMDKHSVGEKLISGSATNRALHKRNLELKFKLVPYASCFTENIMSNISVIHSSSEGKEPAGSRTSSTIITGIGHRQQQPIEVTSQSLGVSSKLLSDMRRSLRKSCVTRQTSRLEVNNCQRQSSGHNTFSSNSSKCFFFNPGFGAKSITNTSEQHLKSSQVIGNFSKMTYASMNKSKVSDVFSSTLKIQVEDATSNSRRIGELYKAKPTHLEAAKPKLLRPKASVRLQRDDQNTCLKLKKKEGLDRTRRCKTAVPGKENAIERIGVSQKNLSDEVYLA